jgi:thiol:disulfide interchange protein DsbD
MIDHVEELADHTPPRPRGKAIGNAVMFVLVVALLLTGWRYLRPSSVLAGGQWMTDWDAAVEQSRATGRPALVLFTADWCPACRQFETDTLSDTAVQQHLSENYTLVVVDLSDQSGENLDRARECRVNGIPTLIRYDRDGEEVARSHGMSSSDLLNWLR